MHNFEVSLKFSHDSETADFWREVYNFFFPGNVAVIRHSEDGDHQQLGIDTSVVMPNSKVWTVDEKLRRGAWTDILVEEYSDQERRVSGWVCKSLLCDFVLYAVPDIGKAYLLPCSALQAAWARNGGQWKATREPIPAHNRDPATGRQWTSINWAIEVKELFPAIGAALRAQFNPTGATMEN